VPRSVWCPKSDFRCRTMTLLRIVDETRHYLPLMAFGPTINLGNGRKRHSSSTDPHADHIRCEVPSLRCRPRVHPGESRPRPVPVRCQCPVWMPGHALLERCNKNLRLGCPLQLRIAWNVDRMRRARGEGGMMRASEQVACIQSSPTDLHCRTCGKRPGVLHTPTRYFGYYCEKCCPACREKPAAKE
jgi:hypothetical protein